MILQLFNIKVSIRFINVLPPGPANVTAKLLAVHCIVRVFVHGLDCGFTNALVLVC
jgi:hypothetical protein